MAYKTPDYTSTVSDSKPAVGQQDTVILRGGVARANQIVMLTMTSAASAKTLTATANAGVLVLFPTTFCAAGVYTLTMTNAAGVVLSTQTVTAHARRALKAPRQ